METPHERDVRLLKDELRKLKNDVASERSRAEYYRDLWARVLERTYCGPAE